MNSKIRIEHDFYYNEPYIQLFVSKTDGDVNDAALAFFVEQASNRGLKIVHPKNNKDSSVMQIKIGNAQDEELSIMKAFKSMCEESTPPELTDAMNKLFDELFRNRHALKGKQDLI